MNLEGNRFLPSSSGLNEHWLYVVYLKSDQVDWSVVQSGLRKIPRNGAGVQCGFGGKLLLSMHKTLGSLPWTTTCPDDSDVQPGLEITLVGSHSYSWAGKPEASIISFPNSSSKMKVGFCSFVIADWKEKEFLGVEGTPGEKGLKLDFLTQVPLLLSQAWLLA